VVSAFIEQANIQRVAAAEKHTGPYLIVVVDANVQLRQTGWHSEKYVPVDSLFRGLEPPGEHKVWRGFGLLFGHLPVFPVCTHLGLAHCAEDVVQLT